MKLLFTFALFIIGNLAFGQENGLYSLMRSLEKSPADTIMLNKVLDKIRNTKQTDDSTATQLEKVRKIIKNEPLNVKQITVNIHLGRVLVNQGKYSKALSFLYEAEKQAKELNDYDKLGSIYNTLGNAQLALKNYPKTKDSYKKCYDIGVKHHFSKHIALGAAGLGNYYFKIKSYALSNVWNRRAKVYLDKLGIAYASCIIRCNMAGNYRLMGQLEQAEKMLEESFSWEKRANFNYASYGLYKEKGELAFARRNYSDAVDSYLKAKELAIREKANHDISEINLLLSQAYEKLGDYKSSTDALKVHLQFKDSVFNEESQKSILDLEEKYKSEQKDAEIKLLNKSNTLNKTELEKKRITIYAFIGFGVLLVLMLVFFVRSNINKQKTNQLLEQKNLIIEEKRKEIVDSINYAKRIQFTLLASNNLLRNNLSNYFVFFQPKDIVSGDFYWAIRTEKYFYLAVCDCTGHGVPGAFMSILNLNFLKEAITEKQITEPGEIFDFVRARLIENFSEDNYSDGMDGILLRFDNSAGSTTGTKKIRYAGANRGPVLVSDEGTQLLPYDKMPVGNGIRKTNFATYDLNYSRKSQLYLFTDGFADQFGGPKGKKFKYKQLQTLLEQFKTETTINQRAILEDTFARWMGELEQVDDVCVFGITLE